MVIQKKYQLLAVALSTQALFGAAGPDAPDFSRMSEEEQLQYALNESVKSAKNHQEEQDRLFAERLAQELNVPAARAVVVPAPVVDIDAKDAQGKTALHRICERGSVADVERLIRQGASPVALDNRGRTPLYYAWSYLNQEVIEHLTGLKCIVDDYGRLVLDPAYIATLPDGYENSEVIRCKKLMCRGYVDEVPKEIKDIALAMMHQIGMQGVHFFITNKGVTFASDFAFPAIGLAEDTMGNAFLARYDTELKAIDFDAMEFKRALYHELCHLKCKHSTLQCLAFEQQGEGDQIFQLSHEMEAELGALYYLFKIDRIAVFINTLEDDQHPSRVDLHRYTAQLYSKLLENPEIEFDAAITPLVDRYIEEKRTCEDKIPDVRASVKDRLARTAQASGYRDQWFIR